MTVYVFVLVLFFQGGDVASMSAVSASKDECEATIPLVAPRFVGQKVGPDGLLVLDAQAKCVAYTKGENA
jgi:hypothetical protein